VHQNFKPMVGVLTRSLRGRVPRAAQSQV